MLFCKLRWLRLRIKPHEFLEALITSSNEVFNDIVFDMAADLRKPGDPTPETAENHETVTQTACS